MQTSKAGPLGRIVVTAGIMEHMHASPMFARGMIAALKRYMGCDWGDICAEDADMNDRGVRLRTNGLMAAYRADGTKLWIVTEADRSVTTVLLPKEYRGRFQIYKIKPFISFRSETNSYYTSMTIPSRPKCCTT